MFVALAASWRAGAAASSPSKVIEEREVTAQRRWSRHGNAVLIRSATAFYRYIPMLTRHGAARHFAV
jgi:hypothetical protein